MNATLFRFSPQNQKQWKTSPLSAETISLWKEHAKRLKFKKTVSHDSYLINLAATDPAIWQKSVDRFVEELTRCNLLGIPYLVTHPGAHLGAGEEFGLAKVAAALDVIHDRVPDDGVITCLEITAGQGSSLGHRLEHLATIIEQVKQPKRLGVCLDTAHLFAAGYDFRGKKYDAFRKELAKTVGMSRIKVIHMNDSKKDLGSRVDRHEHIGRGTIGLEGFRPFVQDESWAKSPQNPRNRQRPRPRRPALGRGESGNAPRVDVKQIEPPRSPRARRMQNAEEF